MQIKLFFVADVTDSEDIRGVCEQVAMCFEDLGGVRLVSVSPVKGSLPVKVGRGPYKNVMLSDVGVAELEERFGKARAEALIADLSYKLYQKNYKFNDHFAVILEWAEEEKGDPSTKPQRSSPLPLTREAKETGKAASFDVDEFFRANLERGIGK